VHCRQGCAADTSARGWLACLNACEAHPHRATAFSHSSYKLLSLLTPTMCGHLEVRNLNVLVELTGECNLGACSQRHNPTPPDLALRCCTLEHTPTPVLVPTSAFLQM
jgi:hypothetical protein